jgi:pimeloyl-ACP methyl ester carboxylesterase
MMNTARSKDGTILTYDVYGSGQPLIYITGASCFRTFQPVVNDVKVFGKEFTVYNYDRRGRGDSGDTQPYSIEREIDDLEAMIDSAGGKAFLYGHSSGAVLALEAALKLENKVEKIVIYDPPYVHTETEKEKYKKLADTVYSHLSKKETKRAMKAFLSGIGMPKLFVWFLPIFPGWKTMHSLAPTLAYDIELTKDFPPLERFKNIKIPTLVLIGGKSPESMQTVGPQIAESIPDADFEKIFGQDHMVSAKALLLRFKKFYGGEKG